MDVTPPIVADYRQFLFWSGNATLIAEMSAMGEL